MKSAMEGQLNHGATKAGMGHQAPVSYSLRGMTFQNYISWMFHG